jgi:hypothetical protein
VYCGRVAVTPSQPSLDGVKYLHIGLALLLGISQTFRHHETAKSLIRIVVVAVVCQISLYLEWPVEVMQRDW